MWPIVGVAALVWFVVRVIPKPSRASYPCQRVAFPLGSAFVLWLMGLMGSALAIRRGRTLLRQSRYLIALLCLAAGVGFIWLPLNNTQNQVVLANDPSPNQPMGTAKGIYPGRVVWIHDPSATDWKGPGYGHPWESEHTNQHAVEDMLAAAVQDLTGQNDDPNAWEAVFRYFNRTHGKGDRGYRSGERITVKINLTTCNARLDTIDPATNNKTYYRDKSDTSPQVIIALLRQLVRQAGVQPRDIALGDTLAYFPKQWWDLCHTAFPDVCYFDCAGQLGRTKPEPSPVIQHWSHGEDPDDYQTDYIPDVYARADYLINLAVLKGHGAGVTLCAKNHYGSYLRPPDEPGFYDLHPSLAGNNPLSGQYRALVDIMGHPDMGGKTLLYLLDGLYGGYYWEGTPYKFHMSPFHDDWPSSLFISQDPVAIDSVGLDLLWEEWPQVVRIGGVDDYLHEAALADAPPSGTFYDPNGDTIGLQSLGVHEHWNNPIDKQYSRNLGTGEGIELLYIRLDNHSPQVYASCEPNEIVLNEYVNLNGSITDDGLPAPGLVTTAWTKVAGPGEALFADETATTTTVTFTRSGHYVLRLLAYDGELWDYEDIQVTVLIPADFDQDGSVNLSDYIILTRAWLCTQNDSCWDPRCDISVPRDGKIDLNDLTVFANDWLKDSIP